MSPRDGRFPRNRATPARACARASATLATAAALFAHPAPARAQWTARVVARGPAASTYGTAPVQVRVGEPVDLTVALRGPDGRLYANAPSVRLRDRALAPAASLPAGTTVRWLRVEPLPEHRDRPSPNPGLRSYSNNVLYGPRHGRWLGYDRIEYETRPLTAAADVTLRGDHVEVRASHPGDPARDVHAGAGSSWYAAEVTLPDGTVVRTPGSDTVDTLGLSRDVLRVSFRAGDDYLAWLSTYFHVPSVFGSNGPTATLHQTDRYTGADCADVLVGALRAQGHRNASYTSVAGIGEYARPVSPVLVLGRDGVLRTPAGAPRVLRWGQDVRAGDLLTIDYIEDPGSASLPRAWDHIGALVEDRGANGAPDGVLSGHDVLRHMAAGGLSDLPLSHEGPIRVMVYRWRESPTRSLRP